MGRRTRRTTRQGTGRLLSQGLQARHAVRRRAPAAGQGRQRAWWDTSSSCPLMSRRCCRVTWGDWRRRGDQNTRSQKAGVFLLFLLPSKTNGHGLQEVARHRVVKAVGSGFGGSEAPSSEVAQGSTAESIGVRLLPTKVTDSGPRCNPEETCAAPQGSFWRWRYLCCRVRHGNERSDPGFIGVGPKKKGPCCSKGHSSVGQNHRGGTPSHKGRGGWRQQFRGNGGRSSQTPSPRTSRVGANPGPTGYMLLTPILLRPNAT